MGEVGEYKNKKARGRRRKSHKSKRYIRQPRTHRAEEAIQPAHYNTENTGSAALHTVTTNMSYDVPGNREERQDAPSEKSIEAGKSSADKRG